MPSLEQVLSAESEVGTPKAEESTTMRCAHPDTSGYEEQTAQRHGKRSKTPMTMKPHEADEDYAQCVTARIMSLASKADLTVDRLLQTVSKSIKKAKKKSKKNWAKSRAEDPNFREEIKTTPVKNKNIFNESAERIAKYFSSPKVSPAGIGQAVKKLNFYLVRGGSKIPTEKRNKVEKAIKILQKKEK